MSIRPLDQRLASASELEDFQTCPFLWWVKWREKVVPIESRIHLYCGAAVSDAIDQFYTGSEYPPDVFTAYMEKIRQTKPNLDLEEFESVSSLYFDVLALYIKERKKLWDNWKEVVGAQIWVDFPAKMKLDLLVRDQAERLVVVDQKVISPFADITFENQKYDLGFQPIMYAEGVERKFGEPVTECIMDYLVRGSAARGRYKAIAPRLDSYAVQIPRWKKDMWLFSAMNMNKNMKDIDEMMQEEREIELVEVPRHTQNCVKKFGSKTFLCDYHAACSVNMHPLQVDGVYEKGE